MDQSKEQILQMLSKGDITAEEAERLLSAITDPAAEPVDTMETAPVELMDLPDVDSLREKWKVGFGASLFTMMVSGSSLFGKKKRSPFGKLMLPFYGAAFVLGMVGALFAYWSREARWLYVNIEEADGTRKAIALPVPIHLLSWLLNKVQPYVDEAEDRAQMDSVLEFLRAIQEEMDRPDGDPIMIDINEDGQRVQVYVL